jgi:predicted transposase YbfD/YdcC
LKDNQPILREDVEAVATAAEPVDTATASDRGHHRSETRAVAVFDAHQAVAGTEWEDLVASIIQVTRTTHKRNSKTGLWDTTASVAYYLASKPAPASIFADAIRSHWGIENRNHYPRDVAFDEDASRIRVNPGVFARLRSFAFNILRINGVGSFVQDRYRAALNGVDGLLQLAVS